MRCDGCGQQITVGSEPIVCTNCGWKPSDLLDSYLEDLSSLDAPTIIDRERASNDACHMALGAGGILERLGMITRAEFEGFVQLISERTGVPIEFVQMEASASDEVEGEEGSEED